MTTADAVRIPVSDGWVRRDLSQSRVTMVIQRKADRLLSQNSRRAGNWHVIWRVEQEWKKMGWTYGKAASSSIPRRLPA